MQIRERYLEHAVCLDVDGRLVLGFEDQLKDKVNSLLLQGRRDILLNLNDVTQLDTTGLSAIIAVRGAVERERGTIKLVNLPTRVHDLLVITKLITVFDVCESEEAASFLGEHADA